MRDVTMAFSDGELVGAELEGDEDLIIASRDFQKIADSRSKVGLIILM